MILCYWEHNKYLGIDIMDNKIEVRYPKDAVVNIYSKPKRYLKGDHVRCFSDEALGLAADKNLSATDLRVLLAIIGNLGYENVVNISQQELEKQLNISQANISKSIKKLINKNYLQIVDTIGRRNIYMLNPSVAFRSRAKNLKQLKQAWDRQVLPSAQKYPIDIDIDLEADLEDKLEQKVEELSQQFGVSQAKIRQILLSLLDQALTSDVPEDLNLPH